MTPSHVRVSFRVYIDDVALQWTGIRTADARRSVMASNDLYERIKTFSCDKSGVFAYDTSVRKVLQRLVSRSLRSRLSCAHA